MNGWLNPRSHLFLFAASFAFIHSGAQQLLKRLTAFFGPDSNEMADVLKMFSTLTGWQESPEAAKVRDAIRQRYVKTKGYHGAQEKSYSYTSYSSSVSGGSYAGAAGGGSGRSSAGYYAPGGGSHRSGPYGLL